MCEVKIAHSGQWRGEQSAPTETRVPSENALAAARYQGKNMASIAAKLAAK